MYAVIETGGKQYRVELGTEIEVDRLDVEPGQTIDVPRVLLVADGDEAAVGRPLVEGARVSASVVRQDRGDKVVVFKYKPKARTRVKKGARAELTVLRIDDITWAGRSAATAVAAEDEARRRASDEAAREAAEQAARDRVLAASLASAAPADGEAPPDKPAHRARLVAGSSPATSLEAPPSDATATGPDDDAAAGAGKDEQG